MSSRYYWRWPDFRMSKKDAPDLSIVVIAYNEKPVLLACLRSLYAARTTDDQWQIIVVDNASSDGTSLAVSKAYPQVELVTTPRNLGFSQGNNAGVARARGEVVLFLNADVIVGRRTIQNTLKFLQDHPEAGAVTCRVELPDGRLDYSCHRGLPTPWNSLCYFSGLSKLFPRSRLFSGYAATYLDLSTIHPVDCLNGTFLMVRKKIGEKFGWWDPDYFFNGEDIEFCYQIKQLGWLIYYFPLEKVVHFKGSASGLQSTARNQVSRETKIATARAAAAAMRIFYQKHYFPVQTPAVRWLTGLGIAVLEKYRLFKINHNLKYE